MSTAKGRFRSQRTPARADRPRWAVLGGGPLATAVAAALVAEGAAVRSRRWATTADDGAGDGGADLAGLDGVVVAGHLADLSATTRADPAARRAAVAAATRRLLADAESAGVRQLVVITSAVVYGAAPAGPVLTDSSPVPTEAEDGLVGELRAMEQELAAAAGTAATLVVLRPAALVGPGVDTMVTRHFEAPRLLTVRDGARRWQFAHVEDVASAVVHCWRHGLSGAFTVAAEGDLDHAEVERLSGMRSVELPAAAAFGTAERLSRIGVLPAAASEIAYVVYPWSVDSAGLRASGWAPRHDNVECLAELLAARSGRTAVVGRRVPGREVMGAAGAAVAVLGTAAIWRQARRRRGR